MPCESPLQWPQGWPRTEPGQRQDSKYRFRRAGNLGGSPAFWTLDSARRSLEDELRRMGAEEVYVTSDYKLNSFGTMRENPRPADQGIAVYFQVREKAMVMAQDAHVRAEENMRALALAVEAMRTLERHGGGTMMEKAFTGFVALPPPKTCWQVLGLEPGASEELIQSKFRYLAQSAHPDRGGSQAAMSEVNAARDEALKQIRRATR